MLVNPWSTLAELSQQYPRLAAEQLPSAVGFEHNLTSKVFESISYLYPISDLLKICEFPLSQFNYSELTPLEKAAKLTRIDNDLLPLMKDLLVKNFWIEVDNSIENNRLQLFFQLPLLSLQELENILPPKYLNLLTNKQFPSTISYLGIVYQGHNLVGYKVLSIGDSCLLTTISPFRKAYVDHAMLTLSNPTFQIGYALANDQILGESIEIDALKDFRFSSCDRWCQLFSSPLFHNENIYLSQSEIISVFGLKKWPNLNLVSGINHIKFGLNYFTEQFSVKLYSGILFSSYGVQS